MLPVFSYAASATVNPSAVLSRGATATVLNEPRHTHRESHIYVPSTNFASKINRDGIIHASTHYSAALYSLKHRHRSTTTTNAVPTTTATLTPTTAVTVAPTRTTSAEPSARTTVARITTTTVAPTTTTTVAPTTTTTVRRITTTTVAPTTTTTAAPTTTTTVAPTTTTVAIASGAPQPVGGPGGSWKLLFDSEFNGSSLDTSQWSTGWFGAGITKGINSYETECMDPAQVDVTNGELNLTAVAKSETCGGVTQPYASGMVNTAGKFSFTYGYLESRIWLPGTSSIADWPAFWADGQSWPLDGENDVVEGLGGLAQAHYHYLGGNSLAAQDGPLTGRGSFTGGWHTFAADWAPGSVTYYYDGVSIGTFTTGVTSSPMFLILDLATSGANAYPGTMRVDYVRVWQH